MAIALLCWICFLILQFSDAARNDDESHTESSSTFPHSFQEFKKGGHKLRHLLHKYTKLLYPDGPKEVATLKSLPEQAPFRAESVPQIWIPTECKVLGYKFKKNKILQDGRNLVLRVMDQETKEFYVWKMFDNVDEYSYELSFFAIADHPNIVKPICFQRDRKTQKPGIVMEYIRGESSLDYFKEHGQREIQRAAAQVYDVLKYMHWIGYVHADFKPENVRINSRNDAIVFDFGFTKGMPGKHGQGTRTTSAPELFKIIPGPIMENIDWWAFGSTVAQWHGLRVLPRRRRDEGKWAALRISKRDGYGFGKFPHKFPRRIKQLLYHCMSLIPERRMFNTKAQLEWFESLELFDGVDWSRIGLNNRDRNHSD